MNFFGGGKTKYFNPNQDGEVETMDEEDDVFVKDTKPINLKQHHTNANSTTPIPSMHKSGSNPTLMTKSNSGSDLFDFEANFTSANSNLKPISATNNNNVKPKTNVIPSMHKSGSNSSLTSGNGSDLLSFDSVSQQNEETDTFTKTEQPSKKT
jgi:hypothetical protein